MAMVVGFFVIALGTIAWSVVTNRHRLRRRERAGGKHPSTQAERKQAPPSAVRLLRTEEDLSLALARARASTAHIAAEIAPRRYARLSVTPLPDDVA